MVELVEKYARGTISGASNLPCALSKVISIKRFKELPEDRFIPNLKYDLNIVSMNKGYYLSSEEGVFLIDEEEFDLIKKINGKKILEIAPTKKYKGMLSELYYHNIIDFSGTAHSFSFFDTKSKYVKLYSSLEDYSWFTFSPMRVEIDLTKSCNQRCIHCIRNSDPSIYRNELSSKEIRRIIKESSEAGVDNIIFMGGEPTFRKDFLSLGKYAKRMGIKRLYTSTNGSLHNKDFWLEAAKYFDDIQVSVHGSNAKTHDYITQTKGSFERALACIKYLKEGGIKNLKISYTVMRENLHDIENMPALLRKIGLKTMRFNRVAKSGRASSLDKWNINELRQIRKRLDLIVEKNKDLNIIVDGFIPCVRNDLSLYGCWAGRALMYISSFGDVSACGPLTKFAGNVRDGTILDLWHNSKFRNLRKKPSCECAFEEICAGPCKLTLENPYSTNFVWSDIKVR